MTEEFSTRKLEPIDTETRFSSAAPQYWAIIVGISEYKHGAWNLQYAHRDAEELYKQLLQLKGARFQDKQIVKLFDEKRICKLVNQEATTAHITDALREFLKKPEKDDIVFLFFACHGTPDPDRTENLYLLTYDTDPERIAGSALPMREIRDAVKETLDANKVIILADTCHSGGLSFSGLRNIEGTTTTRINTYLQDLQQASEANVIFTSAEKNQMSREGAQWGGGHGIFTHYLLEGMRGKADQDQDGIVTLGELLEYVRSRVKEDTDNKQHPSISIASNRSLPITIIDESSAVAAKAIAAMESTFAPRQSQPEGHSRRFGSGANRDVGRQPASAAPKKNILWILSIVGVCLAAITIIFAANHQPKVADPPTPDPTPTPTTPAPTTPALTTPAPTTLSNPNIVLRYYPQGDSETVSAALAPLGANKLEEGVSNKAPATATNAIWFGSQVSLQDVKRVAESLLQAEVPIQAIRPFRNPAAKPLVIEVGADRDIPSGAPVLTVEDIRNAQGFTR